MSSRRALRFACLVLVASSCGGARHRHPLGPPPEYEPPPSTQEVWAGADAGGVLPSSGVREDGSADAGAARPTWGVREGGSADAGAARPTWGVREGGPD